MYKKIGYLFGGVKKNAFYSKIHTTIELQVQYRFNCWQNFIFALLLPTYFSKRGWSITSHLSKGQ
jgi:hypothetical protein